MICASQKRSYNGKASEWLGPGVDGVWGGKFDGIDVDEALLFFAAAFLGRFFRAESEAFFVGVVSLLHEVSRK